MSSLIATSTALALTVGSTIWTGVTNTLLYFLPYIIGLAFLFLGLRYAWRLFRG